MNTRLPKGLDEFVRAQVDAGFYESPEEVCWDGLRLLKASKEQESLKLERLQRELAVGLEQLDRGEGMTFDPEEIIAIGKKIRG